jgi:hypothetical protein
MNLSDAKVMLCNCDGTMTLDGTKLAKACGAEVAARSQPRFAGQKQAIWPPQCATHATRTNLC